MSWTLPPTWDGITSVDRYVTSMDSAPAKLDSLAVSNKAVTFSMAADTGYILVPAGNGATPVTAMFNDLTPGDALTSYAGIRWNAEANPPIRVQQADSKGGFSSKSIFVDSASKAAVSTRIKLPGQGILHSLRLGTRSGAGTIELCSSASGNAHVVLALPPPGETELLETNWRWAETGDVSIAITNSEGCGNTLLDHVTYSLPIP